MALMAGIGLAEYAGRGPPGALLAAQLFPAVLLAVLLYVRRRLLSMAVVAAALLIAATAGFARHQLALYRPPDHIARLVTTTPTLTRACGRVVSEPVVRPPVKKNAFLVYAPPPRTQFVLALEELRTGGAAGVSGGSGAPGVPGVPGMPVRVPAEPLKIVGSVRVSVKARGLGLHLGDRIELTGRIYRPRGPQNPGETDWARWYRYQGIDAGLVVDDARLMRWLPERPAAWPRVVNLVRTHARGLLVEPEGDVDTEEASRLLDVMVLGQRSVADRKLNEAFLRSGTTHFLAVSGFNVALVAGVAWWTVQKLLRGGRRAGAGAMIVATLLFATLAEPNAPVLRAAVAAIVFAVAVLTNRPANALNALSAAAIVVLLINPLELFRAGFQLSFVLVWGLLMFLPHVYAVWRRYWYGDQPPSEAGSFSQYVGRLVLRLVGGTIATCIVAYVVALPLSLWHFGYLTPYGLPASIVMTPGVVAATVLSVVTIVARAVAPAAGELVAWFLYSVADWVLAAASAFAGLPGGLIEIGYPPALLVAGTYGVALLALTLRRSHGTGATGSDAHDGGTLGAGRPKKPAALLTRTSVVMLCCITATAVGWLAWLVLPPGPRAGHSLYVLSVGDGSAMVLTTPGRHALVFDAGTATNSDAGSTVAEALRALGVRRPDLVVVSHANLDHYSGLPTLLGAFPDLRWATNTYFASGQRDRSAARYLRSKLPPHRQTPRPLQAGDKLDLDGATVEVLWPPAGLDDSWPANDRSLVLRVAVGERSILLPGDIEKRAMEALLERRLPSGGGVQADVLIAPHHGAVKSGVTDKLLTAVGPQSIIVSSREDRPKWNALTKAALGPGCAVFTTGRRGAAEIRIDDYSALRVDTPFSDETLTTR